MEDVVFLSGVVEGNPSLNEVFRQVMEENAALKKENKLLRSRVTFLEARLKDAESANNGNGDDGTLLLSKAFDSLYFKGGAYDVLKSRTHLCFDRAGYKTVGQFSGKDIIDLLNVRNAGVVVCAIMIVVLEHFGVQIAVPDLSNLSSVSKDGRKLTYREEASLKTTVKKVIAKLPTIREACVFK